MTTARRYRWRAAVLASALVIGAPDTGSSGQVADGAAGDSTGAAAGEAAPNVPRAVDGARAAAAAAAADGRYLREATWAREAVPGEVIEVPLQLYAGNEYTFCLGYDGAAGAPEVSLRDGAGRLVPASLRRTAQAVLLTVPIEATSVFRIRLESGKAKVALALTYVYR